MRYRSRSVRGIRAYAVCGVNTVSFALTATEFARKGLLGFCVERAAEGGPFVWMRGFKVFPSLVPDPKPTDVGSKSFGGFLIIELPVAATGIGLVVGHRSHWLPSDMILR